MNLSNHPDSSTILAYAAGAVNEGFSLVIAAHLELCPECREAVTAAETLGGGLIDQLPAAEMSDTGMEQVWERIALEQTSVPVSHPPVETWGLPAVLAPFLPGGLSAVRWRTLVPGIKQLVLGSVESGQGSVRLLNISPGTTVPQHTHLGSELTLVLQGSFRDETGHYAQGDLADVDSSVQHQPVVDSDQPCICLIATDQRLKFSSALNRVLQPLVGI
jgi:putative transcriptional regulator